MKRKQNEKYNIRMNEKNKKSAKCKNKAEEKEILLFYS
jgi:hypothetical protein